MALIQQTRKAAYKASDTAGQLLTASRNTKDEFGCRCSSKARSFLTEQGLPVNLGARARDRPRRTRFNWIELLREIATAKKLAVLVDGASCTALASLVEMTTPIPKEKCRAHRTLPVIGLTHHQAIVSLVLPRQAAV
jgi:hypothetical protein